MTAAKNAVFYLVIPWKLLFIVGGLTFGGDGGGIKIWWGESTGGGGGF